MLHVAFAYERQDFINKVADALTAALYHQYLVQLCDVYRLSAYRDHWTKEVGNYLGVFSMLLARKTKMGLAGKIKAIQAAVVETKEQNETIFLGAVAHFCDTFPKCTVPENFDIAARLTDDFWLRVNTIVTNMRLSPRH